MPGGEFSLFKTFAHLEDGPGASEVAVGDRFWEEIGAPPICRKGASSRPPLETSAKPTGVLAGGAEVAFT